MKRLLRLLRALAALAVAIAVVCVARALLARADQAPTPPAVAFEPDTFGLANRLAALLRVQTVSWPGAFDESAFLELERVLEHTFQRAHATLEQESVGGRARLYRFAGSDPTLPPALLLAHLDVVPVEPASRASWTQPPFSGELHAGFVWGRGALDDKSAAAAILEAVDELVRAGRAPRRDVWIAFGYDEELGGEAGAKEVAARLAERGVRPLFVLDEGLFLLDGFIDGLERPLAAIGVAEKGELVLELEVRLESGHAAAPAAETATAVLARALARLDERPMRAALDPPVSWMLDAIAPALPFARRLALANRWLFAPLVRAGLAAGDGTRAALRTTAVTTRLEAGVAENVVPQTARAVVDLRLHPRDTVADALAHVRAAIADPRVALVVRSAREATPLSPTDGEAWELLSRTVRQVFPEAVVAPGLCIAGTDARHYAGLSPNVYRFLPLRLAPEDLPRIHGVDERVDLADYGRMVQFYVQLLWNL